MVPLRDDHAPDCPPAEQLQRVAQGFATPGEESALAQHLDICDGCRGRFETFLATTEEQDALGRIRREDEDTDLSAILATSVPSSAPNEDGIGENLLPDGLRLDPPRGQGFLGSLADFDVLSVLGEGGMGVVLRAVDRSLGRDVALKLLSNRMAKDPVARQRFLQEARSAARLNHPNIVTVHSVAQYKETPYFVMEYVAGTSLAHVLAAERRLESERAVRITCEVLAALEHAHQAGIVHRDVKPANILFESGTDRVKLADFGLARGVADSTRLTVAGSVMGTPWYMAPEQVEGNASPDPRQDLFSMGAVLFEMLAGTLPFPGPSPVQVLAQIRYSDPLDPIRTNPGIPRALADIVLRALQRDPARRFQSAAEFAAALKAFLQDAGHASPSPSQSDSPLCSTSPGSELLQKCSACGTSIIKSRTSLGGTCEVCQGPLCSRCWTVRGVRRCAHHPPPEPVHAGPFPGPAEAAGVEPAGIPMARPLSQEPARAAAVVYPDLSQAEPIPAARVMREEPLSAQPLPDAADSEVKPTSGHAPAASSELFSIRKRVRGGDESSGATGRTVVKASDVGVMVETFLRRVSNALQTLQEVKDPVRGVVVPVRDWEKVARRIAGRAGIVSRPVGPQARASRAQVSNNLLVVYELAARSWLGQQAGRIKIEARSLVRSERLAANGSDDKSMERIDVEAVLNEAAVRAQREGNWHLEILCSPTGWSSDTCRFVCRTNAASFHDRLVSAILFDNDSGRFLTPHNDEKLSSFRNAFSADDDSTLLDWARLFLRDYLDDNQSITHETLAQKLGINRATGIRAMKLLAESGNYNLEFVDGVGWVMSR